MRGIFRGVLGLCASVLTVVILVALGGAPVYANGGSDSPTPYDVTQVGIWLPEGDTFRDGGHVNLRVTGSNWRDLHFEGKCAVSQNAECEGSRHDDAQFIGRRFVPFSAFGISGSDWCVTWVQISHYNQHYGEGGQPPVGPGCTPPPSTPDTEVTPAAPTYVDACGTIDDTYTILSTEGVVYRVDGVEKAAGTYSGTGTVVITAHALTEYVLKGQVEWTVSFTDEACPQPDIEVTAAEPTHVDVCGTIDDVYTIPSSEGVGYQINDGLIAPGAYPGFGSVTIEAYALPGYVLMGTSSWTFVFTDEACPPEIVINPLASVEVDCEGTGEAIFDNSLSTTEVGFELVVNDQVTLYPVSAGEVLTQEFSGATPGSVVVVQDGEANELDSATVSERCDEPEPPTPPVTPGPTPEPPASNPPVTPVGSKQPPSRISVAPNAGLVSSESSTGVSTSGSARPILGAAVLLAAGASGFGWMILRRRRS